jgi:bla regulator protein BlaR1
MIAIANHLWQSTLFAFLAWLLTLMLRRNRASVRCWIWLAASVKFMIPFSLFVALGSRIEWREASRAALPAAIPVAIEQISQPFTTAAARVENSPAAATPLVAILLPIWGCGFIAIALRWWFKWQTVKAAARAGSPLALDIGIPVISSLAPLEPGVFGIHRPVLLLGDGILTRLTPQQFAAVIAHELCHVRRRDNLAAAVHMIVEAMFWFHPLVWWIGTRLIEERERACDEEVLRMGNEPRVYAESILKVCELYLESPVACVAGVTGADLKRRIEGILRNRVISRLTSSKKLLLAATGALVIAAPVFIGMMNPSAIRAQPAASAKLKFEAASVKPTQEQRINISPLPGGRLKATSPVLLLIVNAYNLAPFQISGGPDWIKSDRYDIEAKADGDATRAQVLAMLQSLLEERFRLKSHRETRELPVYTLIAAKGGPKLPPPKEGGCVSPDPSAPPTESPLAPCGQIRIRMGASGNRMQGGQVPMPELTRVLAMVMGRTVIDKTGLTGTFDIDMDFVSDLATAGLPGRAGSADPTPSPADSAAPNILVAIQEKLGLKLESSKGPVEVLVIDHVEKPTAN